MGFFYAILYVIVLYAALMYYMIWEANHDFRQRQLIRKEVERFHNNLLELDAEADIEYHLKTFKNVDDIKQVNQRIEKAIKKTK